MANITLINLHNNALQKIKKGNNMIEFGLKCLNVAHLLEFTKIASLS